ncbi:MAG: YggT family protein [Candidatus Hinthialibacter antarcticus]|nr:YggT family protein [Candidatus Hinthialibacter antarcticus]
MLFHILNFVFQVLIIVLLVRYFVERYRYYGFGPVMVALITITERVLKPIKQVIPRSALTLQDHAPLIAVLIVLVVRGLCLWALQDGSLHPFVAIHAFENNRSVPLTYAMGASFALGVKLVAQLLIAFLFASWMTSRRGINMTYNGGFACFQERTFAVFQFAKRYLKTENLTVLFWSSSIIILIGAALLSGIFNLCFMYGAEVFTKFCVIALFDMVLGLIFIYWFILLIAIIASWISADQMSVVVQMVRAMSDPYLDTFRYYLPWARIDFIDLSPIIAFMVLNPGLVYIVTMIQVAILNTFEVVRTVGSI